MKKEITIAILILIFLIILTNLARYNLADLLPGARISHLFPYYTTNKIKVWKILKLSLGYFNFIFEYAK